MARFCYDVMPEVEQRIRLPGTNNLFILGLLRGSLDDPLIVMMHGLPGSADDLLQYVGARYLTGEGFATLRLFMYTSDPDTRNLVDCTLDIHVADFEAVVRHYRAKGVKTIFATGHSYGGLTILKSGAKLDGATLWDPSHGSYWHEPSDGAPDAVERSVDDLVVGLDGSGYVLSRTLADEDYAMGDTTDWAAHKGYPLEVISAGENVIKHLGKRYIDAADAPKRHVIVPGAHHHFADSDEIMLRLFKETADWFKEILHDCNR